ncbi:TetR/AcrR family transcriptional regulator [Nocardia crassostreae]|uniref:TetR/AcrR family transcriptional regulator n=1 Tax=Nocardia crassostreae TaxID=53428 RepID=UPI0008340C4B|nr:TetR/AcrR family transcriptional regulator [Nocardia crassostreae]
MSTEGSRRRAPTQQRSRARVDQILQAARELVEEGGPAAVTTRALAARAGVPVASIYQYFANREAVLQELTLRSVGGVDADMSARMAELRVGSIADAVDQIVALHHTLYRSHPEVVAMYYVRREAGLFPDPREHRRRLAGMVHGLLLDRGLLRPDTAPLVTEIAVELGDRILELAYHRDPAGDPAILAEARLAMTRYLEAYAAS